MIQYTSERLRVATYSNGQTGKGISKIDNYYYAYTSDTKGQDFPETSSTEWKTNISDLTKPFNKDNKYLWNFERITYTDNSKTDTDATMIAIYSSDGRGITGVYEFYILTKTSTPPTSIPTMDDSNGWTPNGNDIPVPNAEEPFLWNYEIVDYTEGEDTGSGPVCIGQYGNSIAQVQEWYMATETSTKPTNQNGTNGGWKSKITETGHSATKPYLWNYEETTYSVADPVKSPITLLTASPRTIKTITEYYQQLPVTSNDPSGVVWKTGDDKHIQSPDIPAGWSTTRGELDQGKYMWNLEVIEFQAVDAEGKNLYTATKPAIAGYAGVDGVSAKDFNITATSYAFVKAKEETTDYKNSITLTAHKLNLGDAIVYWQKKDGESFVNIQENGKNVTGDTYTPTGPGTYRGVIYKSDNTTIEWSDEVVLVETIDGATGKNAIAIVLSNPTIVFHGNTSGESESCEVIVYEGGTLLGYDEDIATNGTFKVEKAAGQGDVTGVTSQGGVITVGDKAENGSYKIIVSVKTSTGDTSSQDFTIKWKVVYDGVSPYTLSLDEDFISVPATNDGTVSNFPSTTITPRVYLGQTEQSFTKNANTGLGLFATKTGLAGDWDSTNKKYDVIGFNDTNDNRVDSGTITFILKKDNVEKARATFVAVKQKAGPRGLQGTQGIQGIQGERGDQGIQGPQGESGLTSYFHIKYSESETGNPMSDIPSTYIGTYVDYIETDSDDYTKYKWARFEGIQGEKGDQGIPGEAGADGQTSYLHIKYSNVANPTQSSQINDVGGDYIGQYTDFEINDSTDPSKYTWTKIKGEQGAQGIQGIQGPEGKQGIQGPQGAAGETTYFHIKYSSVSNPTSESQMSETPSTYIGTYVDTTENDSSDPSKYKWARFQGIQGEKGDQGIPGEKGDNGLTTYLHIAYANSADGKTDFDIGNPDNKTYIGQYTDYTKEDSTDPTKYKWTLIKGDKGDAGTYIYAKASANIIERDNLPDSVVIEMYQRTGSGDPEKITTTSFYFQYSLNNNTESPSGPSASCTIFKNFLTNNKDGKILQVNVYTDSNKTKIVDRLTIELVSEEKREWYLYSPAKERPETLPDDKDWSKYPLSSNTDWSQTQDSNSVWYINKGGAYSLAEQDDQPWKGPYRLDGSVSMTYNDWFNVLDDKESEEGGKGIYQLDDNGTVGISANVIQTGALRVGTASDEADKPWKNAKFYADIDDNSGVYVGGWQVTENSIQKTGIPSSKTQSSPITFDQVNYEVLDEILYDNIQSSSSIYIFGGAFTAGVLTFKNGEWITKPFFVKDPQNYYHLNFDVGIDYFPYSDEITDYGFDINNDFYTWDQFDDLDGSSIMFEMAICEAGTDTEIEKVSFTKQDLEDENYYLSCSFSNLKISSNGIYFKISGSLGLIDGADYCGLVTYNFIFEEPVPSYQVMLAAKEGNIAYNAIDIQKTGISKFRVTNEGDLYASSAHISGEGTIGSFYINNYLTSNRNKTTYNNTTYDGVFLGSTGIGLGKGKFTVSSAGYLNSTSGYIGSFYIGNYLTSNINKKTYNDTTYDAVFLGSMGIGLGKGTFTVNNYGYLTSTSGKIGGFNIGQKSLINYSTADSQSVIALRDGTNSTDYKISAELRWLELKGKTEPSLYLTADKEKNYLCLARGWLYQTDNVTLDMGGSSPGTLKVYGNGGTASWGTINCGELTVAEALYVSESSTKITTSSTERYETDGKKYRVFVKRAGSYVIDVWLGDPTN